MELTLTGASLNSDLRQDTKTKATTDSSRADSSKPATSHQSHSENSTGNVDSSSSSTSDGPNNNNAKETSIKFSTKQDHSRSHSQTHSHTHGNSQNKPCCDNHNHNSHHSQNYVDVMTVSKEKLTANPALLMNALIAAIRGKGTFHTFTYLVQVVLEFESSSSSSSLGNSLPDNASTISTTDVSSKPMQWGQIPTIEGNSCKSCLNHYSNDGHTIAHWCAKRNDDVRFMEYLVANVPNVNINLPSLDSVGMRPIHWAATEGSIPNVAFILNHFSKNENQASYNDPTHLDVINAVDSSNCTPLLVASQYGHADLVAYLIKRGANPYAVDNAGDTAFHWSAYKGSVPVSSLLLHLHCYHGESRSSTTDVANRQNSKRFGDIYGYLDVQDSFGQSPLHLASLRGNIDVVNYILEEAERFVDRNMDMGQRNDNTSSSLIANADTSNDIECGQVDDVVNIEKYVGMLLTMTDKNGKTPIDLAMKKKHISTQVLLQKFMDKHLTLNQSLYGKLKWSLTQFFSRSNWLLWMGFVSEGGGRPPKFIFWFVIMNLLAASFIEATMYAPINADYTVLHYCTFIGILLTWVSLYFVNQTNPGILSNSSSNYEDSGRNSSRIMVWIQIIKHRISNFVPPIIVRFINSLTQWCIDGENKRIKKEMHSLSLELRRQYDDTLESFATMDEESNKQKKVLCHSCHIIRPPRSKHCRVLNRCILLFDHHCPFVGTTIGLYNYKYFYAFVFSMTVTDILFTITGFLYWKDYAGSQSGSSMEIITLLMVIYFSLYTLMTGGLCFYHTQLVKVNLTTNEHQNMSKYDYMKQTNDDGHFVIRNPFNKGLKHNIFSRLIPGRETYTVSNTSCCNDIKCEKTHGTAIMSTSNKKSDDDNIQLVSNIV